MNHMKNVELFVLLTVRNLEKQNISNYVYHPLYPQPYCQSRIIIVLIEIYSYPIKSLLRKTQVLLP